MIDQVQLQLQLLQLGPYCPAAQLNIPACATCTAVTKLDAATHDNAYLLDRRF